MNVHNKHSKVYMFQQTVAEVLDLHLSSKTRKDHCESALGIHAIQPVTRTPPCCVNSLTYVATYVILFKLEQDKLNIGRGLQM